MAGLFGSTWKISKGFSLFGGSFVPDTETRLYEETQGGYKLTVSGTHGGKPFSWGYSALYDGLEHPVTGRSDVDGIEAYKVNDRITIGFFKKAGQDAAGYQRQLSADGNTLKVIASGKRPDGTTYFDVIVYTK